jgi:hypothetical protein
MEKENKNKDETIVVKQKPKFNKKKFIIFLIIVSLLGVGTGFYAGNAYVYSIKAQIANNISEEELRDNEDKIISQNQGKSIENISPTNSYIIAEHLLSNFDNYYIYVAGSVDAAGTHQTMYTKKIKNSNDYFVENISKGSVIFGIDTNIAERDYYTNSGNEKVNIYKGKVSSETEGNFNSLTSSFTFDEWKTKNGTTPLSSLPYIVSSKTVNDNSTLKKITLDDNSTIVYEFALSLKSTAGLLYGRQIRNLSGLDGLPKFQSINLTIQINTDGSFHKVIVKEVYVVNKVIDVTTTSSMEYDFNYIKETIPNK